MRVGKVLTRLRLSLAACVVLAVSAGVLIATAGAAPTPGGGLPPGPENSASGVGSPAFDPQETNIPYLAWRGEELRLLKCWGPADELDISTEAPTLTERGAFNNRASIFVEDWSGTQLNSYEGPHPVTDTFRLFHAFRGDHRGQNCLKADFISNKPGLAIIKMSVSDRHGVQQVVHSFLAGWLRVNSAAITNPGTVTELPGALPGNSVNVLVTGAIPLNQEFQDDWNLPDPLVLPRDWALWASRMATTDLYLAQNNNGNVPSQYWDIHDSSGPGGDGGNPDIHVSQVACPGSAPSTTIDQVDNCAGPGRPIGPPVQGTIFSRVFGDLGSDSGPFDADIPETLLSDGNLNSFDTPMPALKIVFNSSGGMGGFDDYSVLSDKHCVYNRNSDLANGNCVTTGHTRNEAHALYAPYYGSYIPATSRDDASSLFNYGNVASGTDAPAAENQPNNFNGYGGSGFYQFWEIAQVLVQNVPQKTDCVLTGNQSRFTNDLPTSITEFTDEHGEARAQWIPGVNSDLFATTFVDEDGGCDLEGVALGPQTITAAARYPFQTVSLDIPATGSITKNISNLFSKSVSCRLKNNTNPAGTAGRVYICTASATDITGGGLVFNDELVCFKREPDLDWITVGGTDVPNGTCVPLKGGTATAPAEASLETPSTLTGERVDVTAFFQGEHLFRDTCFLSGDAGPSAPGPCVGGVGGTSTSGTSTSGTSTSGTSTSGTSTSGTSTSGTSTSGTSGVTIHHGNKSTKAKKKASVVSVQLVLTPNGRVLMVRIHSAKKTAKIQIRLLNAKGRVITTVVRTVKANRRVQVPHLRIANSVKTVRVRVLS
jgi:hypothetical protein